MDPAPNPASKRRTGPFGPAGEILPANQSLVKFKPDDNLFVALDRLCEAGFNQAPVMDSTECVGVLRLFHVMRELLKEQWMRDKLQNMPVRNYLKLEPRYIGVDEWVDVKFDWQNDDLAMVGTPHDLKGMLTATDILGRLTDYALAFVALESIEHDTRALFTLLLPLSECKVLVVDALTVKDKAPPRDFDRYDQLEFGHYSLLFGRAATFERLRAACVWDRGMLVQRVVRVAEIRNKLLHFRQRASKAQVDELEVFAQHAATALERARRQCREDVAKTSVAI